MAAGIKAELLKVDQSLSPFNEKSIITAVNQNKAVQLDSMFLDVYNLAVQISDETDGAFDITVAPLVNAWGFGFKNSTLPSPYQVDSLRQIVGYQKVSLENGHIKKKDPRIMLDCSAIAKGYGCDVIAKYLRSRGVKNFMVEIGGEIVTSGLNPERLPWKVGVTKPSDDSLSTSHELQTVLNVTDMAMATSGNYRNFYYKGGKKYAHTIDPKTGFPVQHNILSATVIAKSCAEADAYATSFMVMGLEKAQKVMERRPELMAYIIYSDQNGENAVWYSPSLRNKIVE
jgi:thiamine biosynthesis lipoprotein